MKAGHRYAFMMLLCTHLVGCAPNAKQATATITTIDRDCQIVETAYEGEKAKSSRVYTGSCNSIDDWEKVRAKRNKDIAGKAVMHLTYTAPQTGQLQTGELHFDGHDEEFYKLKAGDELQILVSDADPTKIRKA